MSNAPRASRSGTGVSPVNHAAVMQEAEDALRDIAALEASIEELTEKCGAAQKKIIDRYAADIALLETRKGQYEKNLGSLMLTNKGLLWGEDATNLALYRGPRSEMVCLVNGQLRYEVSRPVALPRKHDALIIALEALGASWVEAVRVKKSLDKDQVNAWPDDQLAAAGLTRKAPEERFDYSLNLAKKEAS